MTAKHTRQKYTEKQTRLAARAIKGAYEEVRVDSQDAKKKAQPSSALTPEKSPYFLQAAKIKNFIQEFIPFRKKKKKQSHKKKK